jgi:hypothetical protein
MLWMLLKHIVTQMSEMLGAGCSVVESSTEEQLLEAQVRQLLYFT